MTLEDVMAEIVGRLPVEGDATSGVGVTRLPDGSLLLEGMLPVEAVRERLALPRLTPATIRRWRGSCWFACRPFRRQGCRWTFPMAPDGGRHGRTSYRQDQSPASDHALMVRPAWTTVDDA